MTNPQPGGIAAMTRKPQDSDIDAYGVTHTGKVRKENQDHFLIGTISKQLAWNVTTSLPKEVALLTGSERLASVAMVADGVGSGAGEEASRLAVQAVAQYLAEVTNAFYTSDATEPENFTHQLTEAALQVHADLLERAQQEGKPGRMATTLTVFFGLWPQAYLLQVGDSRCYLFHDNRLTQISRDQTMAEDLVDQGVLSRTKAADTRWAHVLSSAIGGQQAAPVVTRIVRDWGWIFLFCSDGLTKHVSDERIAERLAALTSAKQTCEALLQDALDGGGSDNITVLIGRTVKPPDTP
jgi:PPM family protein phosphatase